MSVGRYIILEGLDGCGKTTQATLLAEFCKAQGIRYQHIRQPGSSDLSEVLRGVILSKQTKPHVYSELMVMLTCWLDTHIQTVLPALLDGVTVISERGIGSTFAYQCRGREIDLELFRQTADSVVDLLASSFQIPSHVQMDEIYLEQPLDRCMENVLRRKQVQDTDRFEEETRPFFERLVDGYDDYFDLEFSKDYFNPLRRYFNRGHRLRLQADRSIEALHAEIVRTALGVEMADAA